MSRQTEKPLNEGCKDASAKYVRCGLFLSRSARLHDWRYSSSWNGNSRDVLPFWDGTTGVSRSGWRCYHCGKFVWDLSNLEFAASFAVSVGIVKLPKCVPVEQGKLET